MARSGSGSAGAEPFSIAKSRKARTGCDWAQPVLLTKSAPAIACAGLDVAERKAAHDRFFDIATQLIQMPMTLKLVQCARRALRG